MADREDIAYLSDIHGETGNLAEFGEDGALRDSHKKVSDFVGVSDVQTVVQGQVSTATSEIWNAVTGVYAFAAYGAPAWAANTSYTLDAYCTYDGAGYRCTKAHTSGSSFDQTEQANWKLALTAAGKEAIDALLEGYSPGGGSCSSLANLAPRFNSGTKYEVGQLVVKPNVGGEDVLQICTVGGYGYSDARFSEGATVEASISERLDALRTQLRGEIPTAVSQLTNDAGYITQANIPTDLGDFSNDPGYVTGSAIDAEYSEESSYVVGDTCTYEGEFYICIRDVSQGTEWDAEDWRKATLKEVAASWVIHTHPDWDEDDPTSPAYIENKPNISYQMRELAEDTSDGDETELVFHLLDRTVNIIDNVTADGNETIVLTLPASPGATMSRDFYVVLHVESEKTKDVQVNVARAALRDCSGATVNVVAPPGEWITYRFTEIAMGSQTFLVTEAADPAYLKMKELERALDDILAGGGSGGFMDEVYIPDEDDKYHKLTAVTDPDTGEVDIGVEQTGVDRDEGVGVYIPDKSGKYHKLTAVKDDETGEYNIGVEQEGVNV